MKREHTSWTSGHLLARADEAGRVRRAARRRGGFTLLEILIATAILTIGLVSIVSLFPAAINVGRQVIEVCTNVSCALSGAQDVVDDLRRELGIDPGETSKDGAFTLRTVECLGGCGWATVVAVNNRHRLRVQPGDVPALVEELRG